MIRLPRLQAATEGGVAQGGRNLVAVVVPLMLSLLTTRVGLADTVGLAFALAASTFCPLLVLGIWWRGLTAPGALWGLGVGGATSSAAAAS